MMIRFIVNQNLFFRIEKEKTWTYNSYYSYRNAYNWYWFFKEE